MAVSHLHPCTVLDWCVPTALAAARVTNHQRKGCILDVRPANFAKTPGAGGRGRLLALVLLAY
jgi:hypothetical protein